MICPLCHQYHHDDSDINLLFHDEFLLCYKCYLDFKVIMKHFKIEDCHGLAIYSYEGAIKEALFQFKGLYDVLLAPIFFERFIFYLSLYYEGYTIVFVPSSSQDNAKRGFNHVELIYDRLKLKKLQVLYKNQYYKQSEKHFNERSQISNVISIIENIQIPKKILLVDDVMTSGCTLKTCIKLLKNNGAKKIKVLIMSIVCR